MRGLNLNYLNYFHVVATEGSLSKAARRLGVTQPTISEQIKSLEKALGTQLFDRSGGTLRLNEAGQRVFDQTSHIWRASERIQQMFTSGEEQPEVTLDVGVASVVSRGLAADFLIPLFQDPDVFTRLRHGDHAHLMSDLLSGKVDVVLTDASIPDVDSRGLQAEVLTKPQLIATAHPDVAQELRPFPDAAERQSFLHYSPVSSYRWPIDRYFADAGVTPNVIGETDNVALMHAAARRGAAFVVVPKHLVRDDVEQERLHQLTEVDVADGAIFAIYRKTHPTEPVERAIQILKTSARAL